MWGEKKKSIIALKESRKSPRVFSKAAPLMFKHPLMGQDVQSTSFRIRNYLFDVEPTGQQSNKTGQVCLELKTRIFHYHWSKLKLEARRPRLGLEHNTCDSYGSFLFSLTSHGVGKDT